jgi:hypothetical protein
MHNRGLLYLIISVVCFFIATSCNTEKRLQKAEVLLASSGRLPEVCANRFPPKDSIVYRDSVHFDTLYTSVYSVDTIVSNDTVKIVTTLPAKVITKELIKFRDVYRENTAKVTELQLKYNDCGSQLYKSQIELEKTKAELDKWKRTAKERWWFIWILLIAAFAITFRKSIYKFVKLFL